MDGYKYKFIFSDGVESIVDFYPFISKTEIGKDFTDKRKFKEMKFNTLTGDIYWGDWDMCFHMDVVYKEKVVDLKT